MSGQVRRLELRSTNHSEDAGLVATKDLSEIAEELDLDYRLVGGISVGLLTWAHGVADRVPARETADADFGGAPEVIGDERLPAALRERGYSQVQGNRFTRPVRRGQTDLDLVVDLLTTTWEGKLVANVPMGGLHVDAVPGLRLALDLAPTLVEVQVRLSDDDELRMRVALPDVTAALCLKAYAYRDRLKARDALDIWRLLEAASAAGVRAGDWTLKGQRLDAARILHRDFGRPGSPGAKAASGDATTQTRIRALVAQVVARP